MIPLHRPPPNLVAALLALLATWSPPPGASPPGWWPPAGWPPGGWPPRGDTGRPADTGAVDTGTPDPSTAQTGDTGLAVDPLQVLTDGFVWGYPLVFTERVLQGKPVDAYVWHRERADERLDHVPNPDVLYGVGHVDLRAEPAVVHAPDLLDRYWSVQLIDTYVESDAYVGTRATGGLGGTWLIVPPGYTGSTYGLPVLQATTPRATVIARLHVRDDADVPAVVALESGHRLAPLSTYLRTPPPPYPPPPAVLGLQEDTGTNGILFWDELGDALVGSPPRAEEVAVLEGLAAYGIGPGRHPSTEVTDPDLRALLEQATIDGLAAIAAEVDTMRDFVPDLRAGSFAGDFLHRAAWCSDGWVTHEALEAVYARSALLDGATGWILRFEPDELPPVGAFWSVAVYGSDGHLVANPWDRFSLQSTDPAVVYGADGSLEVRMAPTDPGGPAANWLPVDPAAPFSVFLRAYLPGEPVLDGSWAPPPIIAAP